MSIDDADRANEVKEILNRKASLRIFYRRIYEDYRRAFERSVGSGLVVEIGAGGGFAKEYIQELITSDIVPYPDVERVVDATAMPFSDESVRFLAMLNTLHHIPDAERFFSEADRVLEREGRLLIVDQYRGLFSEVILRLRRDEDFDPGAERWEFKSSGPLSGANGALAWIVFHRDRKIFEKKFPRLEIQKITPHSPVLYWMSGGLKRWNLAPGVGFAAFVAKVDEFLGKMFPPLCSFVTYELRKKG